MMAIRRTNVIVPGPCLRNSPLGVAFAALVGGVAHRIRDRKWEAHSNHSSVKPKAMSPASTGEHVVLRCCFVPLSGEIMEAYDS